MTQAPTGRPCPKCGGTGGKIDEDCHLFACDFCHGTGQEYADLPEAGEPPAIKGPKA